MSAGGISIERVKREFREIISSEEVNKINSTIVAVMMRGRLWLGSQMCYQDRITG